LSNPRSPIHALFCQDNVVTHYHKGRAGSSAAIFIMNSWKGKSNMSDETWRGPYLLNDHNIAKHVQEEGPGVFILGNMDGSGKMDIKHVHSAVNLKKDLKAWLGECDVFMYEKVNSVIQALIDRHAISEHVLSTGNF
jgi:hypothetical protein